MPVVDNLGTEPARMFPYTPYAAAFGGEEGTMPVMTAPATPPAATHSA